MGMLVQDPLLPRFNWKMLFFIAFLANAPDLDFLFGLISGNPNQYHRGWTHSLVFVLIVMGIIRAFYKIRSQQVNWRFILISGGVVLSHLIIDMFTIDTSVPYGIDLFWPVSEQYVIAPVTFLGDVHKSSETGTFITSLISMHNLGVVVSEVLIFGVLVGLRQLIIRRKKA